MQQSTPGRVGTQVFVAVLLAIVCLPSVGCRKQRTDGTAADRSGGAADELPGDADSPEERRFLEAGKPFIRAVARNDPQAAYAELSSHARQRMVRAQFGGGDPQQDRKFAEEFKVVSAAQFARLFAEVVRQFGTPTKVGSLSVTETDPKILSGKVADPADRLGVMISIGGMPDSIPASIRRAALRAQVQTSPAGKPAAPRGEDDDGEDEGPYFNVKYVLVEEGGQLKVGYFEFFPPSILD